MTNIVSPLSPMADTGDAVCCFITKAMLSHIIDDQCHMKILEVGVQFQETRCEPDCKCLGLWYSQT